MAAAIFIVCIFSAAATKCNNPLCLPTIFDDKMVLQRGAVAAQIWGNAKAADGAVTVKIGGQTSSSVPSADGKFLVKLPPLALSAKGLVLEVSQGIMSLSLHDVLVGDVFFCAGQR